MLAVEAMFVQLRELRTCSLLFTHLVVFMREDWALILEIHN